MLMDGKNSMELKMKITGGCYCGEVRYEVSAEPEVCVQCHCRECQYGTGGNPTAYVSVAEDAFTVTKGEVKEFKRSDIENPVRRHFCGNCGTTVSSVTPLRPGSVIVRAGTLDDPSIYQPQVAIFTKDKQDFHHIADDLAAFESVPG